MEKKTIKSQFHLEYETAEELFPLQEWYNDTAEALCPGAAGFT